MKTKIITSILCVYSGFAVGIGGLGDVVSDPTSYTYYAEQLEQGIDMLEVQERKLQKLVDSYNKLQNIENNVSGNIQRAKSTLNRIKALKEMTGTKDLRDALKYAKRAIEEIEEIPEHATVIGDNVDEVFGNEEKESKKSGQWISASKLSEKKRHRQLAYKQAIVESEISKAKIKLQLEKAEELATATNTATSLKDSTDVTNTILLEMLENQREMIKHLSNTSRSLSMAYYDGQKKTVTMPDIDLLKPKPNKTTKKAWCSPFFDKNCH